MTGVKTENILGKKDHEYSLPFYGVRRPILIDLALIPNAEINAKYHFVKKVGDTLIAETDTILKGKRCVLWGKAVPLRDSKGNTIGAVESIRDITDRKTSELELKQLKDHLANIINSMPSILVGMDQNGVVTQWNLQAEAMTGTPLEKAIGQQIHGILPHFAPWIEILRDKLSRRLPASMEKALVVIGGERRYYDFMAYPLTTNGVNGAVIRIEDVTERTHIQDMAIQAEKMISVGGLAAGMAHESQQPTRHHRHGRPEPRHPVI